MSACRASSRHTAALMQHMQLCRAGVSLRSLPLIQHPQPTLLFLSGGSCGNAEAAVNCALSDVSAALSGRALLSQPVSALGEQDLFREEHG